MKMFVLLAMVLTSLLCSGRALETTGAAKGSGFQAACAGESVDTMGVELESCHQMLRGSGLTECTLDPLKMDPGKSAVTPECKAAAFSSMKEQWSSISEIEDEADECPAGLSGLGCTVCADAFTSAGCREDCDAETLCNKNGRCRGLDGSCVCDEGWTGKHCNISAATRSACPSGTAGTGCREDCDPETLCNNNGRCRGLDGSCVCFEGWTGKYCNISAATRSVCPSGTSDAEGMTGKTEGPFRPTSSCFPQYFLSENKKWLRTHFLRGQVPPELFSLYMHDSRSKYDLRIRIGDGKVVHSSFAHVADGLGARAVAMVAFLEDLSQKQALPDCDFVIHIGDGVPDHAFPLTIPNGSAFKVPVFVQDGWVGVNAIMAPSRSVSGNFDPSKVKQAASKYLAVQRITKAVWRGSTTGALYTASNWMEFARSKAVLLSQKRPDLLDARFTRNIVQVQSMEVVKIMHERGMYGLPIPMDEQFQYEAILVIDGNVSPDRFAYQLAGGTSAIIKVNSTRIEQWYPDLVPWKHFIPVKEDLSDLEEVLETVLLNSSYLASVARKGSDFVLHHLSPDRVACSWREILGAYCPYVRAPSKHARGRLRSCRESHRDPLDAEGCNWEGSVFRCVSVPGKLRYSPDGAAPTRHCLNASMAWGSCRESEFLCTNFSQIQSRCRSLVSQQEQALLPSEVHEWEFLGCGSLTAGIPRRRHIDKIEELSQPGFLSKSQGGGMASWSGDLLVVSASSYPDTAFHSFAMSSGFASKLLNGFSLHHIRVDDLWHGGKVRSLLQFLQRPDVSPSSLVWFQDSHATLMVRPINRRAIAALGLFDIHREVLFNGECLCHGLDHLCPLQLDRFGSNGPWPYLNCGQFLGLSRTLVRFLGGVIDMMLGMEAQGEKLKGGDQGVIMKFCFDGDGMNASSVGLRCMVDSGGALMRTWKSCPGVLDPDIPADVRECKDGKHLVQKGLARCLTDPVSWHQPVGIHFNGRTSDWQAEVEFLKPFVLLSVDNANMSQARSCVHMYYDEARYQGCLKMSHFIEVEYMRVLGNGLNPDLKYPHLLEPWTARRGDTACVMQNFLGRAEYVCTAKTNVNLSCLTDEHAWGICEGGKLLCLSSRDTDSLKNYKKINRLKSPLRHNENFASVCFRNGYRYECTNVVDQALASMECLDEVDNRKFCPPNHNLCSDVSTSVSMSPGCERYLNPALSADGLISKFCSGKSCLVRNVMFSSTWTFPQCRNRLCFGCRLRRNERGCFVCDLASSSGLDPGLSDSHRESIFLLPHPDSKLNKLRLESQRDTVQLFASDSAEMFCNDVIRRTAILISFDGWNPFHQFLITFMPAFEALQDYWASELFNIGTSNDVLEHGAKSDPYRCVPVVLDIHEQDAQTKFGKIILQSLCRAEVFVLHNSGPNKSACFARLILGATTGDFDVPINSDEYVPVHHSGLRLASKLTALWQMPKSDALTESTAQRKLVTILLRRQRREIVNELDVIEAIRKESVNSELRFEPLVLNLDGMSGMPLQEVLVLISQSMGIVGVHGAGLTNAVFLPPVSIVIEIRVGYARAPFRQLCRQFGLAYLEFTRTYMSDTGASWALRDDRDRKVIVDDVKGLASLVSFGVSSISRIRGVIPALFSVKD